MQSHPEVFFCLYLYMNFLKSLHKSGQQPEKFVALSHCAALPPVL